MTSLLAAEIGAKALYLTYLWLAAAIVGAYISARKGYGERWGLASGLLLTVVGPVIWLFIPAREGSMWKEVGVFGSRVKEEREAAKDGGAGAA